LHLVVALHVQKASAKSPKVSVRIQELVTQALDIANKKSAVVEDLSLLKYQPRDVSSTSAMVQLASLHPQMLLCSRIVRMLT
jgi:hypothetical protein